MNILGYTYYVINYGSDSGTNWRVVNGWEWPSVYSMCVILFQLIWICDGLYRKVDLTWKDIFKKHK